MDGHCWRFDQVLKEIKLKSYECFNQTAQFFKQLIIKRFHLKSQNLFFFRIFSVRLQWEKAEEEEVTQVHFVLFSYKDLDKIEASTDTTIMHDFLKLWTMSLALLA